MSTDVDIYKKAITSYGDLHFIIYKKFKLLGKFSILNIPFHISKL